MASTPSHRHQRRSKVLEHFSTGRRPGSPVSHNEISLRIERQDRQTRFVSYVTIMNSQVDARMPGSQQQGDKLAELFERDC